MTKQSNRGSSFCAMLCFYFENPHHLCLLEDTGVFMCSAHMRPVDSEDPNYFKWDEPSGGGGLEGKRSVLLVCQFVIHFLCFAIGNCHFISHWVSRRIIVNGTFKCIGGVSRCPAVLHRWMGVVEAVRIHTRWKCRSECYREGIRLSITAEAGICCTC